MTNIRPLMKRVSAYLIDLLIVYVLVSLISYTPIVNNKVKSYQKLYSKYKEEYNEYANYLKELEKSYEDSKITEEEYQELIKNEKYQDIIISKYDDNTITKGEYKEIIENLDKQFGKITKNYAYLLNKKGVFNSIITLVCTLLYFGVLQYFLKGQTIGKKLLKLKVVSASDKKINVLNYILRSLVVNDIFLNTIGLLFLVLAKKNIYIQAINVIDVLVSASEAIIIFLVLTREDQRGLHDLLFNTQVIDLKVNQNPANELTEKETKEPYKVIESGVKETSLKTKNKKNSPKKEANSKTKK